MKLKPVKCRSWSGRIQSLIPPAVKLSIFAGVCLLMREPAWAAGVVTSCTEASLRAAMAGGGTVTFACDGTITLASSISNSVNTILDATGHQITISGTNKVQVFCVNSNVTLSISNLTIAKGYARDGPLAPNGGGGIRNRGGIVNLNGVTFPSIVF